MQRRKMRSLILYLCPRKPDHPAGIPPSQFTISLNEKSKPVGQPSLMQHPRNRFFSPLRVGEKEGKHQRFLATSLLDQKPGMRSVQRMIQRIPDINKRQ
jgi:hypothetical protein